MKIQCGKIVSGELEYDMEYDKGDKSLYLHTYNKEIDLKIDVVCKETSDTKKRWEEFWGIFAKTAADSYLKNRLNK